MVCLWITDDLRYIVQDNYHRLSERLEMHRSMSEPPADVRPAPEILSSLQEATTPNSTSRNLQLNYMYIGLCNLVFQNHLIDFSVRDVISVVCVYKPTV